MPSTGEWGGGFSGLSAFHVLTIVTTVTVNLNDRHSSTLFLTSPFTVPDENSLRYDGLDHLPELCVRRNSLEVMVAAQNTNRFLFPFFFLLPIIYKAESDEKFDISLTFNALVQIPDPVCRNFLIIQRNPHKKCLFLNILVPSPPQHKSSLREVSGLDLGGFYGFLKTMYLCA